MSLSLLGVILVFGLHLYYFLSNTPDSARWQVKSAYPLMGIGLSYIMLMMTVSRTLPQRLLGFAVGSAFILWGTEQFLVSPALIAMMDDIVVLLFVFDLSLVVRENLRSTP